MNALELFDQYISGFSTMQIATVDGDQPWVCTVRYLSDAQHNLYWASLPSRRHSQQIHNHPQVACTIVVQDIIGRPVVGIQIEGRAEMQKPSPNQRAIAEKYATTFKRDQRWVEDFTAGTTEHRLYKLTPSAIYLFDEQNFPGGQRQKVL